MQHESNGTAATELVIFVVLQKKCTEYAGLCTHELCFRHPVLTLTKQVIGNMSSNTFHIIQISNIHDAAAANGRIGYQ